MSLKMMTTSMFTELLSSKKNWLFLLFFWCFQTYAQDNKELNDLKKEANKLFDAEDYSKAYPLYSQLVSNYSKDPDFNYRLGVCMIYSEPDKKKCLGYLKTASKNFEKAPKELPFFLGKAHHINYLLNEAIGYYTEFKATASPALQKKMQVDREITACQNCKRLLSTLSDVAVRSKKQLNEADYFRTYDLKTIGGKLLVKPDEFKTSTDKKKKESSVVFLPKNSNVVYFSSYGENGQNGKDIFTSYKQADGTYSKPEPVQGINTEYDEDYPFLHPDGKSLYFASKGHNSMGGYDIFKSVFDENSGTWLNPVNLEFPINSPDDYLFVTDSLEQTAYFSTGRQSPPGKIDVLKINIGKKPLNMVAITGLVKPEKEDQSVESKITIKYLNSVQIVGEFDANDEGEYSFDLPKGESLMFTVETPGLSSQSQSLIISSNEIAATGKQFITYENSKLKISTSFDENVGDENYQKLLKVIEQKAKLDVNTDDQKSAPPVAQTKPKQEKNNTGPTLIETSGIPAANPQNLANKELSKVIKEEAIKVGMYSKVLNQDARDAYELADEFNTSSNTKSRESTELRLKSESIEDETEQAEAITKADQLLLEANQEKQLASNMLAYGKSLEEDASRSKSLSDLNSEFSNALNNSKSTSIQDDATLQNKQNQLLSISSKEQSKTYSESLQKRIQEKETQVQQINTSLSAINQSNGELSTEIQELKTSLEKTRKKSNKETISNQIEDLNTELTQNKKLEIDLNEQQTKVQNELAILIKENELISRIASESIAKPLPEPVEFNANQNPNSLKEKYQDKIFENSTDVIVIEQVNKELLNYNTDITALQEAKRKEISKTKSAKTKQNLNRDIKQLESMKSSNSQELSKNEYLIETLKKKAELEAPVKIVLAPIDINSNQDISTQIENLTTQLNFNDSRIFQNDNYTDPTAKELKNEVDEARRLSVDKQSKLIEDSKAIKSTFSNTKPKNIESLVKDSDSLMILAAKKRQESTTAKGNTKTKLLNDAKQLETESSEKLLLAAEITRKDYGMVYTTNSENIEELINSQNSSPEDISKAKNLMEEASISYKQGQAIREEANAFNSAGAKLGNISNAEEKEAEALAKQKEALDLLLLSIPDYELKVAKTSTTTSDDGNPTTTQGDLNAFNDQIKEVLEAKLNSYLKLFDANDAEISKLLSEANANMRIIENTPSLKTEFLSISKKNNEINSYKERGEQATEPAEKLSAYVNATRKQDGVIPQLNALLNSIAIVSAMAPEIVESVPEPIETTPETIVPSNQNVNSIAYRKISADSILTSQTDTKEVVNYLESSSQGLNNEQAFQSIKSSMNELKRLDQENRNLSDNQKNSEAILELLSETQDPTELRTVAETYENEAEAFTTQAFEKQKLANTSAEPDKTKLLQEAKTLEGQSVDKRFMASLVNQKAFEISYKNNDTAITELKTLMSNDNQVLDSDLDELSIDIDNLNGQIRKLKEEAANLPNRSAQLGALSNVDEKERELLQKQNDLLSGLRRNYPNYEPKTLSEDFILSMQEAPLDISSRQAEIKNQKVEELIKLTNGITLEFETSKNRLPENLNSEQQELQSNAENLNEQSKQLLLEASGEIDPELKLSKMNQSANLGIAALDQLSQLLPGAKNPYKLNDIDALTTIGNEINNNQSSSNENEIKIEGLEILRGNAYSETKPIPFNSFREDGLSFRVQIGAFRTQLPNNTFKGLTPLNGETTPNGYYRYTAGDFRKIEGANAVKNDLRKLGYRDAFVVAYLNGKRISASEAISMMAKEGKNVDVNSPQSAGLVGNLNLPRAILTENERPVNPADLVQDTKELEKIDGLLYTIQIGVYSKQATKQGLMNLKPIFTKLLPNGLFRYTAGTYNDTLKVVEDRNRIVELGINDAFISAYLNGNSISFRDGKKRQLMDRDVRMETQNPVIFPENSLNANTNIPEPTIQFNENDVQPFTNNVSEYPEATETNGVKTNEAGISYKVQIGAFSKQVPNEVASQFMQIKNWPVEYTQINNLFVYNVGNFNSVNAAKELKNELVQLGISDAFVVVYRDGSKIYGAEASTLLSR